MFNKVKVVAPTDGREVISGVIGVNPNNTDYGSIMLRAEAFTGMGTFLNRRKRVAFITGEVESLVAFVDEHKLTPDCDLGSKLKKPVELIVHESTTPFYEDQSPKINPSDNSEITNADGELVYRDTFVVTSGEIDPQTGNPFVDQLESKPAKVGAVATPVQAEVEADATKTVANA